MRKPPEHHVQLTHCARASFGAARVVLVAAARSVGCAGLLLAVGAPMRVQACAGATPLWNEAVEATAWSGLRAEPDLTLRGGEAAPAGAVVGVDAQGVVLRDDAGGSAATRVVAWDRVSSVSGSFAQQASEFAKVAGAAWRARVRLSRRDVGGAEPLFDQLFLKYEGTAGATAGVVASGLLRCRLERGAQAACVQPWLALVASGERETTFDTPTLAADGIVVRALVDPATGLAPALPPLWVSSVATRSVARLDAALAPADAPLAARRAAALGALYAAAAKHAIGEHVSLAQRPEGDDGLALVWDVVAASAGDAQQRGAARAMLLERVQRAETAQWVEAWCRVALGRSMLMDASGDERLLGVANLLHVPSRLSHVSPYLSGLAIAIVAEEEEQRGHTTQAASLWSDLESKYPGHPAIALRAAKQDVQTIGAATGGGDRGASDARVRDGTNSVEDRK